MLKFFFIILTLLVFLFVLIKSFVLMDLSEKPLERQAKAPVYLVSYADGPDVFYKNQKMLAYSGLERGITGFFNYRKDMIDPLFLEKHKDIFKQKKGAGYWIWKPYIILDTLKRIPEGAYVFYCDSGFLIRGDINPMIDLLATHDMVLIAYTRKDVYGELGNRVKKEALIKTGCTTKACHNSWYIWAGILCMKNTAVTRSFVQKWLAYCEDHDLLNSLSADPQARHSYDQSLLSITYYQNQKGVALIDEVESEHIFKWHHRHPNRQEESLFFDYARVRGFEAKIIKSSWFRKIAEWIYRLPAESQPSVLPTAPKQPY